MAERPERKILGIELRGVGVCPGVALGPVFPFLTEDDRTIEREISRDEVAREVTRFEEALVMTRKQIHRIQAKVRDAIGSEGASIFDAHLLVVDDRALVEEVTRGLSEQHRNVESVLRVVADRYAGALEAVHDDYLRERAADIRDVTRRILRNLSGQGSSRLDDLCEPCILVANDLPPSETAVLDREMVKGFATDLGGKTSHTAIMARALEIPAVVGLHDVSVRVAPGDQVLIDGNKGVLIINPTEVQLQHYGEVAKARKTLQTKLSTLREEAAMTKDAYSLLLSANIESPSDVEAVQFHGACGVGLFRSEFLYLASDQSPSEDLQAKAYGDVARLLQPEPVIVRTLDLGGDKFQSQMKTSSELNPFMGWRAIRFCLAKPAVFKVQLRALLRASVYPNVKIMYPMVSNVDEVIRANQLLEVCKDELRHESILFNEDLEVGVMIEVPSAAVTADLFAPHVSFFSLGTNDLVQYTLAVDRVNERIAHLYDPTHPAILKLIQKTIEVGHENGLWVGVCGEMAGNPLMALLLMGMGIDELSMSPSVVPLVKDAIRSVHYSQVEELAERCLQSTSGEATLGMCRDLLRVADPDILEFIE